MSRTARKVSVGLVALLCANVAAGGEFRTADPLKAFVYGEYPLGDDYFIQGNADTYLFRCVLTKATAGFDGVALSENSIWGNRTGPWEVFRQADDGAFVYVETRHLADTSCLAGPNAASPTGPLFGNDSGTHTRGGWVTRRTGRRWAVRRGRPHSTLGE